MSPATRSALFANARPWPPFNTRNSQLLPRRSRFEISRIDKAKRTAACVSRRGEQRGYEYYETQILEEIIIYSSGRLRLHYGNKFTRLTSETATRFYNKKRDFIQKKNLLYSRRAWLVSFSLHAAIYTNYHTRDNCARGYMYIHNPSENSRETLNLMYYCVCADFCCILKFNSCSTGIYRSSLCSIYILIHYKLAEA